ncbi:hypothetical protein NSS79_33735 [Paenibacillus sp. FSL L8-0436]|uniref:hypothetical protein n=1 Tax=Paenibacillus sp. FSL L8-0436 TaxID=2954686 RepID=UPI003158741F
MGVAYAVAAHLGLKYVVDAAFTPKDARAGELTEILPGYYYYITDYGLNEKTGRTPHTLSPLNHFYNAEQDGVKLMKWLDDAVNRDEYYSVGRHFVAQ